VPPSCFGSPAGLRGTAVSSNKAMVAVCLAVRDWHGRRFGRRWLWSRFSTRPHYPNRTEYDCEFAITGKRGEMEHAAERVHAAWREPRVRLLILPCAVVSPSQSVSLPRRGFVVSESSGHPAGVRCNLQGGRRGRLSTVLSEHPRRSRALVSGGRDGDAPPLSPGQRSVRSGQVRRPVLARAPA